MNTEQMRMVFEMEFGERPVISCDMPPDTQQYLEGQQLIWDAQFTAWQAALNSQAKSVLARPIDFKTMGMLTDFAKEHFKLSPVSPTEVCTFSYALADMLFAHQQADKVRELGAKYNELIMAVARKYPNETRHQTALRYINDAEFRAEQDNKPVKAMKGV